MIKNKFSLSLITFLIIGFFFLALTEKGHAGVGLGCCTTSLDTCIGCGTLDCAIRDDIADCTSGFALFAVCVDGSICSSPGASGGCCVISADSCRGGTDFESCNSDLEGIAWFDGASCSEVPECVRTVPTLNQWGLIALALVLGIVGSVGFIVIRRRKASSY